jgi:hypothetical protein
MAGVAAGAAGWGLAHGRATAAEGGFTAPPRGDLRLVLFSDLNGPYGSTGYIAEVQRGIGLIPSLRPDLVLCAGDMVAGQKRGLGRGRLAAMWAGFERDVLSPLRRRGLPFAPAMGNHDASSARSGGRFAFADDRAEAARFWGDRQGALGLDFVDAAGFPFHYAVRRGDLLVLVWDASSATVPAAQLAWAEKVLSGPAARTARRRLVMGHLPLRPVGVGRDRPGEVLERADALRALMERHGVEAYVSGHHHAWYPARLGGLTLYHLGALGSGPRRLLGQSAAPFQTLTVLDLFLAQGRSTVTTVDLRSVRAVDPRSLPASLVDRQGRVLQRLVLTA